MSVNNKLIDIEKLSRYHENLKEVLNTKEAAAKKYADEEIAKLSFDEAGAAAEAFDAAKDYVDDLVKNEDGSVKFDDKGAAAAAHTAAAADATTKANAAQAAAEATAAADATSKANAAQAAAEATAAGLNAAMDERVVKLEAIDHDQIVADAIAAVVAGAESDFDTLKEVADWINSDTTGAAALQIKVAENAEAITDLTNDKQDAISDLETIRTGAAAGAVAEQNAKDYATGAAADAQAAAEATAKAYADAEIVKVNANIEENERVTAESLTDLDTRVKDLKDTTYNKTEIDTMVGNVIVVASDEDIDGLFN